MQVLPKSGLLPAYMSLVAVAVIAFVVGVMYLAVTRSQAEMTNQMTKIRKEIAKQEAAIRAVEANAEQESQQVRQEIAKQEAAIRAVKEAQRAQHAHEQQLLMTEEMGKTRRKLLEGLRR